LSNKHTKPDLSHFKYFSDFPDATILCKHTLPSLAIMRSAMTSFCPPVQRDMTESPLNDFLACSATAASTIRRLLYPNLRQQHIPALVNNLWCLDVVRKKMVAAAKSFLDSQPKYKSHNVDERKKGVIELANDYRDKGVRLLYSQLIIGFSRLVRLMHTIWSRSHIPRTQHIYFLYLTPDSYLLPMHLNDFYPGLPPHNADKGPSARFHDDFNPEELTRLEEARSESVAFISAALQWEKGRRLFWNEHKCVTTPFFTVPASIPQFIFYSFPDDLFFTQYKEYLSFAEEFSRAFEPPYNTAIIVTASEEYVRHVEKMVKVFQDGFPDMD